MEEIYSIIMLLFAIGLVVMMAFVTTYFVGRKSNSFLRNPSIQVLERASIGFQISIYVVQINGKVYVLLIQNKNTQVLDVIDAKEWFEKKQEYRLEGLTNSSPDNKSLDSLSEVFKKHLKIPNGKKGDQK